MEQLVGQKMGEELEQQMEMEVKCMEIGLVVDLIDLATEQEQILDAWYVTEAVDQTW